jgi:UDP-N-acetylglucosamine 1-carboxyvinyltransferase
MRASFFVLGPILARLGQARIPLPGGCAIGSRPVDLHLKGLRSLGARVTIEHGFVEATADRLLGAPVYLDYPSVGATETIMMAACLAEGTTVIDNCAQEPEIVDLASFLTACGARIAGAGTEQIVVQGRVRLGGADHTCIPDRVEAGTYMIATAITGGNVALTGLRPEHVASLTSKLQEMNASVMQLDHDVIGVTAAGPLQPVDVRTMPFPGFPTDLQAQIMSLLALVPGTSVISETVFENRFLHVDELLRMGANIKTDGNTAVIQGVDELTGAPVKATDLRAGAALVLAGLAARGQTIVAGVHHIDRGYEELESKLHAAGARISRSGIVEPILA